MRVLSGAEREEVIGRLKQKVNELRNPNLTEAKAMKIKLWVMVFDIYLSEEGQLFLAEETVNMESHRQMLLEKLAEFAPSDVAQGNAEYKEKASMLQELIAEISNRPQLGEWW
jgi:hypothetical protein